MSYEGDGRLPVIYVRGYAGGPSGIDKAVDDPFYGFNAGSVQVRVDGADRPVFHQFESPLLRLMTDHSYGLIVQGDQLAYLQAQPDGSIPAATIWVHRFYDEFAADLTKDPNAFSIERAAASLVDLILLVRRRTGAPRVFLVAHSMGGLVVRAAIQKAIPDAPGYGGTLDAARAFVDRVFTYATPHGGIDFAVGGGLLEKLRDTLNPSGADIFGPARMAEYLTPALAGPPHADGYDATVMPDGGFPLERLFCLVGTDSTDYGVALGLSAKVVGARSDGLVQIDNAAVRGAPRALVHRSHSGPFGIVNSEEGYQNLSRFLFGDISVVATLTDLALPGTPDDDVDWQLEVAVAIRGLPVMLHEQSTAYLCPIQIELPATTDTPATPVPLVHTYLSTRASRPADDAGAPVPTMRHVVQLRLLSLRKRHGFLSFADHLEQTADWSDVLVVDIAAASDAPHAWAVWNSTLASAISAWAPDPATDPPLTDEDPAAGSWRARVPVPEAARGLLGANAAVTIEVRPRATVDIAEAARA